MPIEYDEDRYFDLIQESFATKQVLVEGDSWVSHPQLGNLAFKLEELGENDFNILNIAFPGDEAEEMLRDGTRQRRVFDRLVTDTRFGYEFDLIFLSAGGNDIVGQDLLNFVDSKNENPSRRGGELLNDAFRSTVNDVAGYFRSVLTTRDNSEINSTTPVITHVYSYLEPRQRGTHIFGIEFNQGWIDQYLEQKGITDRDEKLDLVKDMLNQFHSALAPVQQDHANFLVIDTLPLLSDDNGNPIVQLFHDEIHPNSIGFRIIAEHIRDVARDHAIWPS